MKPIRVLLADDHSLFRSGIRMLVERMADVEIIGEARNGREIFELLKTLHPHIVLMDIAMPELNGLEATKRIVRDFPWMQILVLSMYATPDYVAQALRAGATGYLLKDAATSELEHAIKTVARGEIYVAAALPKPVVVDYLRRSKRAAKSQKEANSPDSSLTLRQREILQLVAEGKTTKEIGLRLSLSENTIETHRRRLMRRLNVHDVTALVRYAIRTGLVPADESGSALAPTRQNDK